MSDKQSNLTDKEIEDLPSEWKPFEKEEEKNEQ